MVLAKTKPETIFFLNILRIETEIRTQTITFS